MRKNKKKIWRAVLSGLCTACMTATVLGVASVASACSETSGTTPPPTTQGKPVSALPETYETYAVGETISIRSFMQNINGKNIQIFGALIKDGETYATVDSETPEINYVFTETGEYTLMWYYTQDGVQTVVKNETFTVGYQPYFNVAFASEYVTGETVSLITECIYDGQAFNASVEVLSPKNEAVALSDMALTLSENGKYKVTYSAKIGEETFTRDYYLTTVGRAQDYADYINPISGVQSITSEFVAPDYIADYIEKDADPATALGGKGLLVEMDGRATFRYRNVVDLNTLDKETDIVKLAVLGSDGYDTLATLQIKLIDVYDPDNVVAFHLQPVSNKTTTGSSQWVYANILYNNVKYSLNSSGGMYINSRYGKGTNMLFSTDLLKTNLQFNPTTGKGTGNGPQNRDVAKATWGHFAIDYADRAFYVMTGQYNSLVRAKEQTKIVDLDAPDQVGKDNEWEGFTTGEAYVEISVTAQGSKTAVILQEVAGEKLYKDNDNDKGASPWFEEKVDGKLPTGETDTFYPFAKVAYSHDTIDGKVLLPEYEVVGLQREVIKGLKYADVSFQDGGFTPSKEGVYVVTYKLKDQDGNERLQTETFDVVNDLGQKGLEFSYDLPETFTVGGYFTVPKLTKKGFSYLSKVEESISYGGVEYASQTNEKIFLDKAGTIAIKCKYQDFLGREYTYEKDYAVNVSDKAITNMLGTVPKYAIKGKTIVLPDMTAVDYHKDVVDGKSNTEWKLLVDGQEIDTAERSFKIKKNHGETVFVAYVVGGETVYSYDIKVIEANYLGDRFYATDENAQVTTQKDHICLTATGDSVVEYVNAFILEESTYTMPYRFTITQAQASAFESIDVYYSDYENPEACIFVRITKEGNFVYAQINGTGERYVIPKINDAYDYSYTIASKTFTFAAKEVVETTANGKDFNGFASRLVNVRFVFNGVTQETQLNVYSLCGLTFLSSYEADGVTLKKYTDAVRPSLVSEKTFRDNSLELGSTMFLPAVVARTALSGLVTARVTVIAPSGKKLLDNQNAYNDQSCTLSEFGDYKLMYTVPMGLGTENIIYNFRVYPADVPEITIAKAFETTYAGGAKITIPEVTVSGMTDYEVKCYFVKPDNSREKVEAGKEFTLTQYGIYRMEVVVTDEYNTVYESWTFKVEG